MCTPNSDEQTAVSENVHIFLNTFFNIRKGRFYIRQSYFIDIRK